MNGIELLNNKEIREYIEKESKWIDKQVGNHDLGYPVLWVICEDYYQLRLKIEKQKDEQI